MTAFGRVRARHAIDTTTPGYRIGERVLVNAAAACLRFLEIRIFVYRTRSGFEVND